MSARDDLIAYLTRRLEATVDQDPSGTAARVVGCLPYVADEHDDVETTTFVRPEREFIRQRWILIKIPNGSERLTLPYEQPEGSDR